MSSVVSTFSAAGEWHVVPGDGAWLDPAIRRVVNKFKGNGKALEAQACWMAAGDYV
jgi:hypothetical protein